MPEFLLDAASQVQCQHSAASKATPFLVNPRVKVNGQNTILVGAPYGIAGCTLNTPCISGAFTDGTGRVQSLGLPLVLKSSPSTSAPNGSAMQVRSTQQRVTAT